MFDSLSVSDVMGYMSIACWLGAQFPQVVENIKLQSCEGLALPFLANWLLGDISNLIGCILTHQLPFQTYLATYFVCVDCILVIQYYYYYKPPKGPSTLGHIRSASLPSAVRRMSIDRGASRYRAISAAASNVASAAAAAALASRQGERDDRRATRYSTRYGRTHLHSGSHSASRTRDDEEEEDPSGMMESFRSEQGGREHSAKRVSWSIERHRGRAASVSQAMRSPQPNNSNTPADGSFLFPQCADENRELSVHASQDLTETPPPVASSRPSRFSRKGSTMLFLSIWALFGIGSFAHNKAPMSHSVTDVGQVLASTSIRSSTPITFGNHHVLQTREEIDLAKPLLEPSYSWIYGIKQEDPPRDPHEDPSSEQILGRIFAWLCTTLYLTSRLPQIWKNYVRKSVEGLSMYLFIFAFLGNCFYVSSILLSPRRFLPPPQSSQFIRESIPYLLGSGGTLVFDITIVGQSFCFKPRHKRHSLAHVRPLDEEEAGLLSGDALSAHPDSSISNRGRTSRIHNVHNP